MAIDDDSWFDEAAGPLVRPYAMTSGRARPANTELDMITMVHAMRPSSAASGYSVEHERVVDLCQQALSVAELAATLDVPLVTAKVLVSDLVDAGDLAIRPPVNSAAAPDTQLLQAVLDGIRRL